MVEVTARMVKISNSGGEQHMQRPKSTEICLQKSLLAGGNVENEMRGTGAKAEWKVLNASQGVWTVGQESNEEPCSLCMNHACSLCMNHAVEEFIWQMGLEVKDRKEEVIQEAVTTVQTTENKSRNWGVRVGEGEREAVGAK